MAYVVFFINRIHIRFTMNEDEFSTTYANQRQLLLDFASKRVSDHRTVEDVVQTDVLKLWDNRKPVTKPAAWLQKTFSGRSIDHYRRAKDEQPGKAPGLNYWSYEETTHQCSYCQTAGAR